MHEEALIRGRRSLTKKALTGTWKKVSSFSLLVSISPTFTRTVFRLQYLTPFLAIGNQWMVHEFCQDYYWMFQSLSHRWIKRHFFAKHFVQVSFCLAKQFGEITAFYDQIYRYFSSTKEVQNLIQKTCIKHFCMKRMLIKCRWNLHLVSLWDLSYSL